MTQTLFVMCGLPAAGKSTVARALGVKYRAVVLSADSVRDGRDPVEVFAWLHAECLRALGNGRSVVVDVCALRSAERAGWRDLGRRMYVRCEVVLVLTPWQVCRERNLTRDQPAQVRWLHVVSLLRRALKDVHREGWDHVHVRRPGRLPPPDP